MQYSSLPKPESLPSLPKPRESPEAGRGRPGPARGARAGEGYTLGAARPPHPAFGHLLPRWGEGTCGLRSRRPI